MFELWIPVTIAAGFFQNLRSAVQKKLKSTLSTAGAAYSRFFYAVPIVVVYLVGLIQLGDFSVPEPNTRFYILCLSGGISQILFTVFLLWTFTFKSFAVGTTFSKLEVIMVAMVATLVLGESLNGWAVFAIAVSSLGVFALSMGQASLSWSALYKGLFHKSTYLGLTSAAFLGASSALYRGATQALGYEPFYVNAAYTLAVSLIIQTILMGGYILIREPGSFLNVLRQWRWAGLAGMAGAFASLCWFTAFTLQKAAYVRALGQSELVFTFIVTLVFFREKISRSDIAGVILIAGGIVMLLLLG
jgi:drug/metabolite transporter (DMT)-like permease